MDTLLQTIDATTADGKRYRLRIYQTWVVSETPEGKPQRTPGSIRILGPAGETVNRIEDGLYDVFTRVGIVRVTSLPGHRQIDLRNAAIGRAQPPCEENI